jgi:hypothetical protein
METRRLKAVQLFVKVTESLNLAGVKFHLLQDQNFFPMVLEITIQLFP